MSTTTVAKPARQGLADDVRAGVIMALVNVPGALANGLLAGVNPVFGLYSMIAGTSVAALFTSSVIMNVDSTSATALATLEALGGVPQEEHLSYLVVLGLLVGLFMLTFGLLKLGSLVRFISNSVMTGFLSGLGVLTVLGQLGDLTGYYSDAGNKVFRAIDTVVNWREIIIQPLLVGLLTILIIVVLERTRFAKYSLLAAVLITTIGVALLTPQAVAIVGDTTAIPRSLPSIHLPDLSLVAPMLLPALTIAIIALVQAAGVSGSIPNPDGQYPDPSGDFRGQGAGNLAAGLVGGLPVGGSLSGTIMIQSMGGKSRWANITTGLAAAVAVLLVGGFIELIPMATLAGLLTYIGFSMINVPRIEIVWNTGTAPLAIMLLTFIATLFTPLQVAVMLGVVFHIVLYVFSSAEKVRIERVIAHGDGSFEEREVPAQLPSQEIVILQPIGSLFFAGAAEFEENLPSVGEAQGTAVIIRLRDRHEVGSTFLRILDRYVRSLQQGGNLLVLVGLNQRVFDQLERTELLELIGEANVFLAEARFTAALEKGLARARAWQAQQHRAEESQS